MPLDFTYRLDKPAGKIVIHVGKLVDAVHDVTQTDKDIVIEGNRITRCRTMMPHPMPGPRR